MVSNVVPEYLLHRDIKRYGYSNSHPYGQIFLEYNNGLVLVVTPYRHGPFFGIEGFGNALLFDNRNLIALVEERLPSPLPYIGFWSKNNKITQLELGSLLADLVFIHNNVLGLDKKFYKINPGFGLFQDLLKNKIVRLDSLPSCSDLRFLID